MLDSVTEAATAYLKKLTRRDHLKEDNLLPNVDDRNWLGEDSTEQVGTAEVDKKKVVVAFKELLPEGSMLMISLYLYWGPMPNLSRTAEMTMMLARTDNRVSVMSRKTMKPP